MNRKETFFWLLASVIFVIMILPGLFMDGMFQDGTQYACVSKNLAEGRGTFWFPYLSATWTKAGSNAFMEQPPLMYALQAPFFKVLGSGMFTERIYTLLTAIITSIIIHLIWRQFSPEKLKKLSWLPIIFWLSIPLMSWTYRQNMQENTMGIFTTLAVFFGLKSIYARSKWALYAVLTGVSLFLATFTKGVPGLFPIVIAGVVWLISRDIKLVRAFLLSGIYLLTIVLIYALLMIDETARESLSFYFNSRLVNRVSTAPVVESHFYMAWRLFLELIPAILLLGIIILTARKRKLKIISHKSEMRRGFVFVLLGLAGSMPLMLTLVQRGFYMSISFPCFGIAFAYFAAPYVQELTERMDVKSGGFRISSAIVSLLLLLGILATIILAGKPGRNSALLSDVYLLEDYMEPYSNVSCSESAYHHWPFQFYMLRYNDVYLERSDRTLGYYIVKKGGEMPHIPELYERIDLQTSIYDLYIRKE